MIIKATPEWENTNTQKESISEAAYMVIIKNVVIHCVYIFPATNIQKNSICIEKLT